MSVELGVVCPEVPDAEQVARLVGPLMIMVLRRPVIHALIDDDHDRHWKLLLDGTSGTELFINVLNDEDEGRPG